MTRYGWRPDLPLPDLRDDWRELREIPLPADCDVRLLPIYDQGALGSSTANALAHATWCSLGTDSMTFGVGSRRFSEEEVERSESLYRRARELLS